MSKYGNNPPITKQQTDELVRLITLSANNAGYLAQRAMNQVIEDFRLNQFDFEQKLKSELQASS